MKKIGFIDYYLDEWHANNYPKWIKERAAALGLSWTVAYAWADVDKNDGLTTAEWCEQQQVMQVATIEQLVQLSDAIIVLSPDHPEHHERLSQLALQSGKPVYMDKTFAPDVATALAMFSLAERHQTPLFSSSALRFADEIQAAARDFTPQSIGYASMMSPGKYSNYAVHPFEMVVTLMGTDIKRIKCHANEWGRQFIVAFHDGRQATVEQTASATFQATMATKTGEGQHIAQCSHMFENLIDAILQFFETPIVPVPKEETVVIMALIEAGSKALKQPDQWIEVMV
ncbi:Gfo/Idh/MocA family oxidoreductase [Paenibacillus yanchengensis]|uniref:Gfo/Idh/MocA family oxidoreductase n=1 Tax=Paenibacillus yanchengensis TaxID=2035833 RepID=A0ABW4YHW9_9BACL